MSKKKWCEKVISWVNHGTESVVLDLIYVKSTTIIACRLTCPKSLSIVLSFSTPSMLIFHNTHTTSLRFKTHWPSLCFSNTGCPFIPYSLNHALPFQISAQSLFPWGNVPRSCGHSTFPKQMLSLRGIYQLVFAIFRHFLIYLEVTYISVYLYSVRFIRTRISSVILFFIFFKGTSILFFIVYVPIYLPNSVGGFLFSIPSQKFIVCRLKKKKHKLSIL